MKPYNEELTVLLLEICHEIKQWGFCLKNPFLFKKNVLYKSTTCGEYKVIVISYNPLFTKAMFRPDGFYSNNIRTIYFFFNSKEKKTIDEYVKNKRKKYLEEEKRLKYNEKYEKFRDFLKP